MNGITVSLVRASPVPLYHQLAEQLSEAIECGRIEKGAFLPNELELASHWQLSRPTVRRAIQELVEAGLIVRRRGIGTRVVSERIRRPVRLSSLFEDLRSQGATPSTRVLVHERRAADDETAEALGISRGDEFVFLERLRLSGAEPFAILTNHLLVEAAGDITTEGLERSGLYELLRSGGVRPRAADQEIGAKVAARREAKLLNLTVGAPLVTMRRVMQDDSGRTVELGTHVYDARRYSVQISVIDG